MQTIIYRLELCCASLINPKRSQQQKSLKSIRIKSRSDRYLRYNKASPVYKLFPLVINEQQKFSGYKLLAARMLTKGKANDDLSLHENIVF